MPISKKLSKIKEPLGIDLQLMAAELDTSVDRMKFLSHEVITDSIETEAFKKLCEDIEFDSGCEITAFDDYTILYEYLDEAIILHTNLGLKTIIFSSDLTTKIEAKLDSYK